MGKELNLIKEGYNNRLKGKLFGCLCEREKGGEWEKFLDSILLELYGFPEEEQTINWITLCHKLSRARDLSYRYFRSTIFDCISLISEEDTREVKD